MCCGKLPYIAIIQFPISAPKVTFCHKTSVISYAFIKIVVTEGKYEHICGEHMVFVLF
jgi:hypothetical protein